MAISKDIIEDIRARCDIVELIGGFVPLKRAGGHTYKGLCPFHQEKTPSFHVDGSRQWYHCFGCGKGGDVFRFLMEKENLTFIDAVQMLASRAGVVIPESLSTDRDEGERRARERERLYTINEKFSAFFCECLRRDPNGPVGTYLAGRGIPQDTIERFKIGCAPDAWTAGLEFGRRCGFQPEEMLAAGVLRRKEETGRIFDQFRNRLVFTIDNEYGRTVGFSARSLDPKPLDGRKYINTGETTVFKKGRLLYALPYARQAMGKSGMAILCEGQLDAIAFHRAGIECAVAPLGTAFTPEQALLVKRQNVNKVVLAFDADGAGQKAVLRAAEILLPLSVGIEVMRIPGGKDPDEVFRTGGAEALRTAIDHPVSWLEVLAGQLPDLYDLSTAVGRGQAAGRIAEFLRLVSNRVELEVYVKRAAELLEVSEDAIFSELSDARRAARPRSEYRPANPPVSELIPNRSRAAEPRTTSGTPSGAEQPVPLKTSAPRLTAEERREAMLLRPALLSLLELVLCGGDAARAAGELLDPEEITGDDTPSRAINLAIGLALNDEYDELPVKLAGLLDAAPDPEISRLLVEHVDYGDRLARAAADIVSELRRVRLLREDREISRKLRDAATPESEKIELLRRMTALRAKLREMSK